MKTPRITNSMPYVSAERLWEPAQQRLSLAKRIALLPLLWKKRR